MPPLPSKDPQDDSLGQRIFRARLELSVNQEERISQEAFGRMLGALMNRDKPITGATVSRWEANDASPDLVTVRAIAMLCEVDPGWLAFGPDTDATGPDERRRELAKQPIAGERDPQWAQILAWAIEKDRERSERLARELQTLERVDTPKARKRQQQIVRELADPMPTVAKYFGEVSADDLSTMELPPWHREERPDDEWDDDGLQAGRPVRGPK